MPNTAPASKTPLGWTAWYSNGRVYSSRTVRWADLPDDGVVCIRVFYPDHNVVRGQICTLNMFGHDWYGWDNDKLFVGNDDSLEENARRYPQIDSGSWKRGIWVTTEEYNDRIVDMRSATWDGL